MFGFAFQGNQIVPFCDPGPSNRVTQTDWGRDGYVGKIEDALAWSENHGIRIPKNGRHSKYLKLLKRFQSEDPNSSFYKENSREIAYAKYEVHEFDRIHRWLRDNHNGSIKSHLADYVSGPDRYTEESRGNSNSRARDIGLELSIGSEFASIGLTVSYGNPSYPEPMLTLEGKDYAVQCKRVSSSTDKSLKKKIAIASGQVKRNILKYPSVESGIVVLDITKTLNPSGELNINPTGRPQFCEMRRQMHEISKKCHQLTNYSRYPEVSLLIVRATYLQSSEHGSEVTGWHCSKNYFPNPTNMNTYKALDRTDPIARTYGVGFDAVIDNRHDYLDT